MLASMSQVDWSRAGMSEVLPTGTVTLLLADVEGSTRLWQSQPDAMTAAVAQLDQTVAAVIAAHGGARPVEQGEGDSFVAAFTRASDAVACALELQRAPLAPITMRIGIHTGEVQLRDEANYVGPAINRTARLRELAHGGQTVLSGSTYELVVDCLPPDAWLTELGSYRLRDLARPERVIQLCHPDLCNSYPPLRTPETTVALHLPTPLTTFIGRGSAMKDVQDILRHNRLVTLSGAGGLGKTRLAIQVAHEIAAEFGDGAWYVDLAPIADPDVLPVAVIRSFGLPDQPGRSTTDIVLRFAGNRRILLVLDNCEHLLDATADLVVAMLGECPNVTLLATSREPIGTPGEVTWRVPSLSLADEAIELFTDRARLARPDFRLSDENRDAVTEICRRLDGMPLAIELAAPRIRALSPTEILDGLRDRFRLLTGGSRTAVRRQQTLHASVDWSHSLLTEPERILFRRLAVFIGGFDLDAAQFITGSGEVEHFQVLDQLTLLVDKSLVVAEAGIRGTRYRLLETVRQYSLEKLGESGEADAVRTRHRDYYTAMAALLDAPARSGMEQRIERAEIEIDNTRAAFAWSRDAADFDLALQLASSLQPLWLARGRLLEGLSWFSAGFADVEADHVAVAPAVRAQALADKNVLGAWAVRVSDAEDAKEALAIAREVGEPILLARALSACGFVATYSGEEAGPYLSEAIELTRAVGDEWRLSQIIGWQAYGAFLAGDPIGARAAGEEGRNLGELIGDGFVSRFSRNWGINGSMLMRGDLTGAAGDYRELVSEAVAAGDVLNAFLGLLHLSHVLAYQGDSAEARAAALRAIDLSAEIGDVITGVGHLGVAIAALADADTAAADKANEAARRHIGTQGELSPIQMWRRAEVALAVGDLDTARQLADDAVSGTTGWHLAVALSTRARVAVAQGRPEMAERDVHQSLAVIVEVKALLSVPETLECLARVIGDAGGGRDAARLFGAADSVRQRMGAVRFRIHDADAEAALAALRNTMGDSGFESAWAEGAALTADEAIAYARRGRGERKRPSSGWAALTPTELDVVRLVSEGLGNKGIGERLFMSPRT
ncbi:MAG: hypothetical protein QOD39_20, partial [Mycobacterium sp.]|nr:hypothetical protein [Mycobacterium sp.]